MKEYMNNIRMLNITPACNEGGAINFRYSDHKTDNVCQQGQILELYFG
jgi:hypothetical protein